MAKRQTILTKEWDKKDIVEKVATVGIYGFGGFILYKGYLSIKVLLAKTKAEAEIKELVNSGQPLSYSNYQYDIYADGLYQNFGYWYEGGTDEEGIKAIFMKMNNDADLFKLIQAYAKHGSLAGEIYTSLDRDDFWNGNEIEKYVNAPLRMNGVKYQF